MTVSSARSLLLQYVGPDGTTNAAFLAALNQLRKRLFDSGKWKDLTLEVTVVPVAGIVTLPATCESVLGAQANDCPVPVFDKLHPFQPGGPGHVDPLQGGTVALIDNGDRTLTIMGGGTSVTSARLRCKRRYVDLTGDSDTVFPDNVGALKLGLMSLSYEDKGDLDRAEQYFAKALSLLNGESKESRGGAQAVLQQSPHGFHLGRIRLS